MNRFFRHSACLLLPLGAFAGTRTYDIGAFESLQVASGVDVEVTLGATRSVVAETGSDDFDDLRVAVDGKVLKIDRPSRGWFSFHRTHYKVRVVTPVLHSVATSSGADVVVKGPILGDFSVDASSGSETHVSGIQGGAVKARATSGSDVELSGSCTTLAVETSSGADLDARELRCESATVQSSSGSDISLFGSQSVTGKASSGSDVRVRGAPPVVQVEKSSGADVTIISN